ncbi:heterodisulfide reductase-related iron-sulfur binding cluster [Chloroflexota bacterium]
MYLPPRQIINSINRATLVEMEKHKQNGFCCGGGGSHM